MTLVEQRRRLVEDFRLIDDPQDRLSALVERGRQRPELEANERVVGNLVPGCVSTVHLVAEIRDGNCHFRIDSNSALIKGLAGCFCELYSGRPPSEILGDPDGLVGELGLDRMVTPNRLRGISRVRVVMHSFARSHLSVVEEPRP